jgi:DNA-binding NarL/FixJ family response regulator
LSSRDLVGGVKGEAWPARVLIADDHPLAREGLQAMMVGEPDLEVVGEAADGGETLELCRELRPDLVLMDVQMPEMDGLEATRAIRDERLGAAVLIVTGLEAPDYLLEAVRAGAAGYVLKYASREALLGAVRGVLDGESPLNGELAMQLLARLADGTGRSLEPGPEPAGERREESFLGRLTPRELDVLRLLAGGKTNREITQQLHLSLSTVKTHLEHIMVKLEVSDRTQAALKAVELGLRPGRE